MSGREMKTKDRIVREALALFSVKGYRGTSIKNIADAVGIRDSSLYKHFRSKREIFDTIVKDMQEQMNELSVRLGMPGGDVPADEAAGFYDGIDRDRLRTLARQALIFYLTDELVSGFWRLAHIEQYQEPEIYDMFRHIFMEQSLEYMTALFREMMERGALAKVDPGAAAMNFYAPVFLMLSRYSGRPECVEEVCGILDRQMDEFCRIYGAE